MRVAYTGWTWISHREPEYAKRDLEQSFRECKYLGYDCVENFAFISDYYSENPQELVALTEKCGVKLVNLYGHFGFDEAAAIETGKKQLDFLAAIGGESYNCQHGGGEGGGMTQTEKLDAMCRIAGTLGEYAAARGLDLCFHPHFGTCVFEQSDIDYFMAHTDPKHVSLCIDTAHSTLAGIDPAALIRQYGGRLKYMHLKDVDTCALAKAEGPAKMASFRALGLGTVDFPAVMDALRDVGYDGVLCVELDRPAVCNYNSAERSRRFIKDALGL